MGWDHKGLTDIQHVPLPVAIMLGKIEFQAATSYAFGGPLIEWPE